MLKVKVSGEYLNGSVKNGNTIQEYEIEREMPNMAGDPTGTIRDRYLKKWLKEETGKVPAHVRTVYVEVLSENDKAPSFEGKDIFKMTEDELQDLATVFGLRGVPAPKAQSIKIMRERAATLYLERVLGVELTEVAEYDKSLRNLDFTKFTTLKVKESVKKKAESKKVKKSIVDIVDGKEDENEVIISSKVSLKELA